MIRVIIVCEGLTERDFIIKVIKPYLSELGIYVQNPLLGKPGKKGGDVRWSRVKSDIINYLKSDKSAYCTTFLDFYGMNSDIPGRIESAEKDNHKEKKQVVENAILYAIEEEVGDGLIRRFKPYIQMYEIESLLFSDIEKMSSYLGDGDCKIEQEILSEFGNILKIKTPEEINDSRDTAPSKRIKKIIPNYNKVINGIKLAEDIGLQRIREKCTLFSTWMKWLEGLSEKE
jgi:hypothetical protein